MNFFCFIYPSYSPTGRPMLIGPYDNTDKAMEAGLRYTAGTPEDPVNQGSWDYVARDLGSTTLRDTKHCAPVFTITYSRLD